MDCYLELGESIDSTKEQIIAKYRFALQIYKPGSKENQLSTEKFQNIFKAYYILSDDFRREKYNIFYKQNLLNSDEYKLWNRNQFRKLKKSKDKEYSIISEITLDVFANIIIESIGSIFD